MSHEFSPLYFFGMKTNLMHYLSLIYVVSQPLHVSGLFIAHHQEVFTVYYSNWYVLYLTLTGRWLTQYRPTTASVV
jgi:hypothetical protein